MNRYTKLWNFCCFQFICGPLLDALLESALYVRWVFGRLIRVFRPEIISLILKWILAGHLASLLEAVHFWVLWFSRFLLPASWLYPHLNEVHKTGANDLSRWESTHSAIVASNWEYSKNLLKHCDKHPGGLWWLCKVLLLRLVMHKSPLANTISQIFLGIHIGWDWKAAQLWQVITFIFQVASFVTLHVVFLHDTGALFLSSSWVVPWLLYHRALL